MPPKVSILLPAFNAAATIERAIASLQAQTFRDWELVAIDDGSVDGTGELVSRLTRADNRIRILGQEHGGLVSALQRGLAEARGELIARMDADDVSHPERLTEQVQYLAREPEVGLVGCLVEFGGSRTASEGYARHVDWLNALIAPDEIALNRFVESPLAHPSVMFRRELVAQHGGYRAGDFPEDYELWLRWLAAGVRMAKVPRVLLTWNDGPQRLSRSDPRYEPEKFFTMKAEWIAREIACVGARSARRMGEGGARRLFVWGAGRPTRKRAARLECHGVKIAGYIDVDAKKTTPAIGGTGAPVMAPANLPAAGQIFVLGYVSSRGAREQIRGELGQRGYTEGLDFLMCA